MQQASLKQRQLYTRLHSVIFYTAVIFRFVVVKILILCAMHVFNCTTCKYLEDKYTLSCAFSEFLGLPLPLLLKAVKWAASVPVGTVS
jgi:hypothetical protein